MSDNQWAMLAVPYDEVQDIGFPVLGQPKLNGVRAKWDGKTLTSRQGKTWRRETLPHIFEKLERFSAENPGVVLDAELYAHGLSLQEIIKRVAVHRNVFHKDHLDIDFHAFDIISDDDTESRQITLSQIYQPWTAVCKVETRKDVEIWLNRFCEAGFEGLMLRQYHCPYRSGRTEMLIKVKPWKYGKGVVAGFTPGEGKYKGMLGAIIVKAENIEFRVSGGLTDEDRINVWRDNKLYLGKPISYRYRDLSAGRKPLSPQVVMIFL